MALTITLTNRTDETLTRAAAEGNGATLPLELGPDEQTSWEATSGRVRYEGASGAMGLSWPSSFPGEPIQIDTSSGYLVGNVGLDLSVRKPVPSERRPVPVAPDRPNVVDSPDELQMRRDIVAKAKAELDLWNAVSTEDGRVPLRQKYLTCVVGLDVPQLQKAAADHTNTSTHWCGIFAIWCVKPVRNDAVAWAVSGAVGGHPSGVLMCTDLAKMHIGDIGVLHNDPEVVRKRSEWQKSYSAAMAANASLPMDQRKAAAAAAAGDPPPAPANHHVLATSFPDSTKIEIIQGNSGDAASSPYASYSLVSAGSVLRRPAAQQVPGKDIDVFYCTVPAKSCMANAKAANSTRCPVANGQPCVLPGP